MAKVSKRKVVTLLVMTLIVYSISAYAQSGFGLVEGRITCNDGDIPARGASVQLIPLARLLPNGSASGLSKDPPSTTSDFSGDYSLLPVEPGIYVVDATMAGYADDLRLLLSALKRYTPEQQKSLLAAFPQITVKAGSNVRQDLVLRRAGAISGKVSVDIGGALSDSLVTATLVPTEMSGSSANGGPAEPFSFSQSSATDDRGGYRISGLPPGTYLVSVRVGENFFDPMAQGPQKTQRIGFADLTVFAPEMLAPSDAKPLKIADGDEINNVDITVPTRLLHSLSGIVIRGGRLIAGITITLEDKGNRPLPTGALSMLDGSYRFDLLPDGDYTLVAKTYSSGKVTNSTRVSVQLHGSDVVDMVVNLTTGEGNQ